jgi:membrane-associated phospholipid phosphatase
MFLQSTFYSGRVNLKDLFFSGHTAIVFLFVFIFTNPKIKWVFTIAGMIVGVLVMFQHAHYSIDVMAAPVFSYFSILIMEKINYQ